MIRRPHRRSGAPGAPAGCEMSRAEPVDLPVDELDELTGLLIGLDFADSGSCQR